MSEKRTFTAKVDDKDITLDVRKPSNKVSQEAHLVYAKAFKDAATKGGAILRQKVMDILREQGVWDDAKQRRFDELTRRINDAELKLKKKGAAGLTKAKARDIALDVRRLRAERRMMDSERARLDNVTAEGIAEQARFNFLVSQCTVNPDTGSPYFKSHEEFLEREEDPVAIKAATEFAFLHYGVDPDFEKSLPENKFLRDYGYANDDLHLVDKDGNLIDADGRRVDRDGRYVNDKGQFTDRDGNPVDADGEYVVESAPFLDEEASLPDPVKEPEGVVA